MGISDVCSTEDAVRALLEHLVDPMLPAKSSLPDTPSQSQQQAVAKQVHAVMLLYNYYHRKRYPQLEVLGFYSFCQLAVILKPALLVHLKFMMKISNQMECDDLENQLSLVEKTIMKGCDISRVLDTSREVPDIEGWPISKVAVFLVDSSKENCLLLFSSITHGVWSMIEKDVDISHQSSEGAFETKLADKKRRLIRKPSRIKSSIDLADFQQLAYSAVKEATGITQTDLTVLEQHVVYSLTKEKEATHFYIVQCTQSLNKDVIHVPIKDVIDSLQGPLFIKNSGRWEVTPVVEYFHVLPYGGILSEWMHRLKSPTKSAMYKNQDGSCVSGGISKGCSSKTTATYHEPAKEIDMNGFFNAFDSQCCDISYTTQLDNTQKVITSTTSANILNGQASGFKNKFQLTALTNSCTPNFKTEKVGHGNEITGNISSDQSGISNLQLVVHPSNYAHLEKIQITMDASKGNMLSQTALEILKRRRDKLSLQLRNIQDDIAECDGKIQTILNGSDDFTLKIESLIEGCNDVFLRSDTPESTHQLSEDQLSPQYNKPKRLPDAILTMQNPCQELDAVCSANNWILPTYHICPAEGEFRANVTVIGTDFECSSDGDSRPNPHRARESAAAKMMVKLQNISGSS